MSKRPFASLPPLLRAFYRVSEIGMKLGVMPTPQKVAMQPVAKRQATKPPRWMSRPPVEPVEALEQIIDSRGGPLRLRIYRAMKTPAGSPGLLFIHGGGFVMGGLDGADHICRELAIRTGTIVVSVEYRLAPQDKFPAALEDCHDALLWMTSERPYDLDGSRIAVGGDSAGGNLTASLMILLRDQGGPKVMHQTLIYPLVDAKFSCESWVTCAGGGVDLATAAMMMEHYAGDRKDDPLVGALAVADLSGLPPALVITAEVDVLHDEGVLYAERLLECGVPTKYVDFPGMPHGFLSMSRLCKSAWPAFDLISSEIVKGLVLPAAETVS